MSRLVIADDRKGGERVNELTKGYKKLVSRHKIETIQKFFNQYFNNESIIKKYSLQVEKIIKERKASR